jgi:hypothetical protein
LIKPFTFTIEPKEQPYRPGDLVGQPFFIPLSQVALSNNLADILTDLTMIDLRGLYADYVVYLTSEPPALLDGQAFPGDMKSHLGRITVGSEWYRVGDVAIDEQHRLQIPIYKTGDSKGAYGLVVMSGVMEPVSFKSSLIVKLCVQQA